MVRLLIGYIGLSVVGPLLFLFATTFSALITAYMTPPLALATLAFLMLLVDVARRDNSLTQKSFVKVAAGLSIACVLLVAAVTQLVSSYLPEVNLGAPTTGFDMLSFTLNSILPLVAYSALLGGALWHISINGNPYIQSVNAADHSKLIPLKRAPKPEATIQDEKKVANLD